MLQKINADRIMRALFPQEAQVSNMKGRIVRFNAEEIPVDEPPETTNNSYTNKNKPRNTGRMTKGISSAEFKTIRQYLGFTSSRLSDLLKVDIRTVQYWESGSQNSKSLNIPDDAESYLLYVDGLINNKAKDFVNDVIRSEQRKKLVLLKRYHNERQMLAKNKFMNGMLLPTHVAYLDRIRTLLMNKGVKVRVDYVPIAVEYRFTDHNRFVSYSSKRKVKKVKQAKSRMTPADFKTLREGLGFTTSRLAKILKVHMRTIQYWETNQLNVPLDASEYMLFVDRLFNEKAVDALNAVTATKQESKVVSLQRYRSENKLWDDNPSMDGLSLLNHAAYLMRLRYLLIDNGFQVKINYL